MESWFTSTLKNIYILNLNNKFYGVTWPLLLESLTHPLFLRLKPKFSTTSNYRTHYFCNSNIPTHVYIISFYSFKENFHSSSSTPISIFIWFISGHQNGISFQNNHVTFHGFLFIFPIWKGCNDLIFLNIFHFPRFQLLSSNLHFNHNMFDICHPFVTLWLNCIMHIQDIKRKCRKLSLFSNCYAYNEH